MQECYISYLIIGEKHYFKSLFRYILFLRRSGKPLPIVQSVERFFTEEETHSSQKRGRTFAGHGYTDEGYLEKYCLYVVEE